MEGLVSSLVKPMSMKPETAAGPKGVSPSFSPTELSIFKAMPHLYLTHFTLYINVWQSTMDWISGDPILCGG